MAKTVKFDVGPHTRVFVDNNTEDVYQAVPVDSPVAHEGTLAGYPSIRLDDFGMGTSGAGLQTISAPLNILSQSVYQM